MNRDRDQAERTLGGGGVGGVAREVKESAAAEPRSLMVRGCIGASCRAVSSELADTQGAEPGQLWDGQ